MLTILRTPFSNLPYLCCAELRTARVVYSKSDCVCMIKLVMDMGQGLIVCWLQVLKRGRVGRVQTCPGAELSERVMDALLAPSQHLDQSDCFVNCNAALLARNYVAVAVRRSCGAVVRQQRLRSVTSASQRRSPVNFTEQQHHEPHVNQGSVITQHCSTCTSCVVVFVTIFSICNLHKSTGKYRSKKVEMFKCSPEEQQQGEMKTLPC